VWERGSSCSGKAPAPGSATVQVKRSPDPRSRILEFRGRYLFLLVSYTYTHAYTYRRIKESRSLGSRKDPDAPPNMPRAIYGTRSLGINQRDLYFHARANPNTNSCRVCTSRENILSSAAAWKASRNYWARAQLPWIMSLEIQASRKATVSMHDNGLQLAIFQENRVLLQIINITFYTCICKRSKMRLTSLKISSRA